MSEVRKMLAARTAARDWTDDELVLLASARSVAIKKHNPHDHALWAQARRLVRAGRLKFVCEDRGFLYFKAR